MRKKQEKAKINIDENSKKRISRNSKEEKISEKKDRKQANWGIFYYLVLRETVLRTLSRILGGGTISFKVLSSVILGNPLSNISSRI